jgi:hypothetical protein
MIDERELKMNIAEKIYRLVFKGFHIHYDERPERPLLSGHFVNPAVTFRTFGQALEFCRYMNPILKDTVHLTISLPRPWFMEVYDDVEYFAFGVWKWATSSMKEYFNPARILPY